MILGDCLNLLCKASDGARITTVLFGIMGFIFWISFVASHWPLVSAKRWWLAGGGFMVGLFLAPLNGFGNLGVHGFLAVAGVLTAAMIPLMRNIGQSDRCECAH